MPLFPFFYLSRKSSSSNRLAFSLVELLIAVLIFSIVIVAIYSTFSGGISVFRKIINVDIQRQKVLLKIERFAREVRQQVPCRSFLFLGSKDRLSFPGLSDFMPSRITYYYDNQANTLYRVAEPLSEIITHTGSIDPKVKITLSRVFLKKIKGVNFSYLFLDLKNNDYVWLEEWSFDYLPIAVKIIIKEEKEEYVKIVFLPLA
jgi:prepilin-type N-terminal cleavage/methylation domain-containing protein